MGRELQKKKNKSSVPRQSQRGPSKKKVLSNPIIAKHWYGCPSCPIFARLTPAGTRRRHSRKTTAVSVSPPASTTPPAAQRRLLDCSALTTPSPRAPIRPLTAPPTSSTLSPRRPPKSLKSRRLKSSATLRPVTSCASPASARRSSTPSMTPS
jgi:hypothetical protein